MTKKIATLWTDTIIRCDERQESKRAIISYGMELLVSTIIGVGLILAVSLLAHEPLAWLFFLLAFAPLRHTAGGYHANSHFQCYLVFTIAFLIGVILGKILVITNFAVVAIVCFSCVTVIAYSPCVPDNKPISSENRKKNRKLSIVIISLDCLIAVVFFCGSINISLFNYYFWGVLSASASLLAARINILSRRTN